MNTPREVIGGGHDQRGARKCLARFRLFPLIPRARDRQRRAIRNGRLWALRGDQNECRQQVAHRRKDHCRPGKAG